MRAMLKEAAAEVTQKQAQAEKATATKFLSLAGDLTNVTEPIVQKVTSESGVEMTVAVFAPSAFKGGVATVSLGDSEDGEGAGMAVSIPASVLSQLSVGGRPVALTAAPIPKDVAAQLAAAADGGEDGDGLKATAPKPVLASAPLSLTLFDSDGNPLKNVKLAQPINITLQPVALEGSSCVYWDEDKGSWATEGLTRIFVEGNGTHPGPLVCQTTHLTIFGAIFGDIAQVLRCSNAGAMFAQEGFDAVISGNGWVSKGPALALWISIGIFIVALVVARLSDMREAKHSTNAWRKRIISKLHMFRNGLAGNEMATQIPQRWSAQMQSMEEHREGGEGEEGGCGEEGEKDREGRERAESRDGGEARKGGEDGEGREWGVDREGRKGVERGDGGDGEGGERAKVGVQEEAGEGSEEAKEPEEEPDVEKTRSTGLSRAFGLVVMTKHAMNKDNVIAGASYAFECVSILFEPFSAFLGLVKEMLANLSEAPEGLVKSTVTRVQGHRTSLDGKSLKLAISVSGLSSSVKANDLTEPLTEAATEVAAEVNLRGGASSALDAILAGNIFSKTCAIVPAVHPWVSVTYMSMFLSHTARLALVITKLTSSMAVAAVFYNATGGTMSNKSDPTCVPRVDPIAKLVQSFTVSIISTWASDCVVAALAGLASINFQRTLDDPDSIVFKKLMLWRLKTYAFWFFTIGYNIFCLYIVMVFLASVSEDDGMRWFTTSLFGLLEEFMIMPVFMALALASLCTVILCCKPSIKGSLRSRITKEMFAELAEEEEGDAEQKEEEGDQKKKEEGGEEGHGQNEVEEDEVSEPLAETHHQVAPRSIYPHVSRPTNLRESAEFVVDVDEHVGDWISVADDMSAGDDEEILVAVFPEAPAMAAKDEEPDDDSFVDEYV